MAVKELATYTKQVASIGDKKILEKIKTAAGKVTDGQSARKAIASADAILAFAKFDPKKFKNQILETEVDKHWRIFYYVVKEDTWLVCVGHLDSNKLTTP